MDASTESMTDQPLPSSGRAPFPAGGDANRIQPTPFPILESNQKKVTEDEDSPQPTPFPILESNQEKVAEDEDSPQPTPFPILDSSQEKVAEDEDSPQPPSQAPSRYLTFAKHKKTYRLDNSRMLRNNLLAGVGFLELANAGDFAANVWNQIPVPHFAMVLMVLGGLTALCISHFAIRDAILSQRNIKLLQEERSRLLHQKHELDNRLGQGKLSISIDAMLDVNRRELGTEYVDRFGMDIIMGFGAVTVGIGTFMAIGGANPKIYRASNLLSGYIGNVPCAVYGLANLVWSIYVWLRAHWHRETAMQHMKTLGCTEVEKMLQNRTDTVKIHAVLNGGTSLVAGAFSLVTVTRWWAYVPLLPCIVSSAAMNYFWRNRIGYERLLVHPKMLELDGDKLSTELVSVKGSLLAVDRNPKSALAMLFPIPTDNFNAVIDFFREKNLLEGFCIRILSDSSIDTALFSTQAGDRITLDVSALSNVDAEARVRLLVAAEETMSGEGLKMLRYRERFLLEVLGCLLRAEALAVRPRRFSLRSRKRENIHAYLPQGST